MESYTLEQLSKLYKQETNIRKKDKIIQQVFDIYWPLSKKLCKKFRKLFEPDVVMQHIHIGIFKGLGEWDVDKGLKIETFIFKSIQIEISDYLLRPLNAKANIYKYTIDNIVEDNNENTIYDIIDVHEDSKEREDRFIVKIDVDNAVKRLPAKERKIIELWLKGFTLREIHAYLSFTSSLHESIIFFYFKKAKIILQRFLSGYEYDLCRI